MEIKKEHQKSNKGFSLVELIVVVAIMAILVAVLAPQFLKYVKSSRKAVDINNAAEIAKTLQLVQVEDLSNIADATERKYVETVQKYMAWSTTDAANDKTSHYQVLCGINCPDATVASNEVIVHSYAGAFNSANPSLQTCFNFVFADLLGKYNGKTLIKMQDYEPSKRDVWIVCIDKNGGLHIYVGAMNGENWMDVSTGRLNDKSEKQCYQLWPEVDPAYYDI
ncbi:MAG: type II secretion system GspH family protein [Lachnospiraceae bacterium]|nr:type II secretion system GspH family protein [Lachnospiraceae bacterium]